MIKTLSKIVLKTHSRSNIGFGKSLESVFASSDSSISKVNFQLFFFFLLKKSRATSININFPGLGGKSVLFYSDPRRLQLQGVHTERLYFLGLVEIAFNTPLAL